MNHCNRTISLVLLACALLSIAGAVAAKGQAAPNPGVDFSVEASGVDGQTPSFERRLAANKSGKIDEALRLLNSYGGDAIETSHHPATGAISFIRFPPEGLNRLSPSRDPVDEANLFLQRFGIAFGVGRPTVELRFVDERQDVTGMTHLTYLQEFEGIEVFGGQLRVHLNGENRITAVNGSLVPDIEVDPDPAITLREASVLAKRIAIKDADSGLSRDELIATHSRLVIFRDGLLAGVQGNSHLAYEVEVVNRSGTVREFVYLDAYSGRLLEEISGIYKGLDRRLYQSTLDIGNLVWNEGDGFPTGNDDWNDELSGSKEAYNLFASMSGWDSYDDGGSTMHIVNDPQAWNCTSSPNATWNGVSANFCPGVTADDVVAHEWAHAYTEYTNGLTYLWQSGALNESFSDIWGETVDLLNGRMSDSPNGARTGGECSTHQGRGSDNSLRWLVGEDAIAFGGALRDMWNPNCYGDPGKVTDAAYHCSESDAGGVHTNSGVPNHLFALLVDGGSYNGRVVPAIGLTRAAHIHWRAQSQYLGPASNFFDHADALEQSCQDLIGLQLPELNTNSPTSTSSADVVTEATCSAVGHAIDAVMLRNSPNCGFSTLLEPNAPALCTEDEFVHTLALEDWEAGALPVDWTAATRAVAKPGVFVTEDWAVVSSLPAGASGEYAAFVEDAILNLPGCSPSQDQSGVLYLESPTIHLPTDSLNPRLALDHWVATEPFYDGGNLKISVNGGGWQLVPFSAFDFNPYNGTLTTLQNTNPLEGEPAFNGTDEGSIGGSWGQSQIDLSGLVSPGDDIKLRFELGIDACNGRVGWYLDTVHTYFCSTSPPEGYLCGNAQLDVGESCDDGNLINRDGCSNTCVIESGWTCTAPGAPYLPDGGFELGAGQESKWTASSTNFGTPICSTTECSNGSSSEGDYFAWFGGIDQYEKGILEQSVAIETNIEKLKFDLLIQHCDSDQDYLNLEIDSNLLYATDPCSETGGYVPVEVNLLSYGDGKAHTITLLSEIFANNGSPSNFFVDNLQFLDKTGFPRRASVCTNWVYLPAILR